jgi:[acyl-carrier-protein] S-malonyltransferase
VAAPKAHTGRHRERKSEVGKIAFVFPGQGAQKVGMGKDAYEASAAARAVFDEADAALGERLSTLCFEGPEEVLQLTANTQPAILTTCIALFRALDATPDVAAGHSLGEYAAHVAAGTLAFADAVGLVRLRGRYMQEAVPVGAGAMAAVMGGEREAIARACREAPGRVEPVNYNCPGQIVIAGEADAVAAASAVITGFGAKVVPLKVSAPFHSSLMAPAEERLRPHLDAVALRDPDLPVYVNVDAAPVTTAEAARDALIRQVSRPVRWEESVERMVDDGVSLFVEIGPGKVLTGLIGRIRKEAQRINVQGVEDLQGARAAIAAARAG